MEIGQRNADGDAEKIGGLAVDWFAVAQDADFCCGAADVHGDDVVESVGFREIRAGVDSQDGAGLDSVNRFGFGDSATPPLMWLTRNVPVYPAVSRSSSSALKSAAA